MTREQYIDILIASAFLEDSIKRGKRTVYLIMKEKKE